MNTYIKAIITGLLGAFFFAFNFILTRSMNLGGGFYMWNAVLRYSFTLVITALCMLRGNGFRKVFGSIQRQPVKWLLWSTVGFGFFYGAFSMASVYGESWFTAAMWQFTIVAGVLLTPVFGKKIPMKNLLFSVIIVAGIFLMQYSKIVQGVEADWPRLILTMSIAAFAYPLGNRKMMEITGEELSTMERVFGMTLCSMPFWIICAVWSCTQAGLPSASQCFQGFLLALMAGVIGTVLFFSATSMVRNDPKKLAVIEATQAGEVVFTLILGVLILKDGAPDALAMAGLVVIIVGMILNSLA